MTTKSPVYKAVEQILNLFGLNDKIALYSYRNDFAALWELDAPMPNSKSIWCVVDDSFGQFRWLPIGVWGHYYRAKGGFSSPRLILIGEEEGLNPKANKESVFVPDFYRKEEDCIKSVKLNDTENIFIVNLCNSIESLNQIQTKEEVEAFSPKEQSIEGWEGIIRNTLSLPEKRHRISNEIAPIILRKAIDSKKGCPKITKAFLADFPVDNEKRALLTLWEWASSMERNDVLPAVPPDMTDVWGIWSKAKYLLIDDQGRQGYDKILKCALAIMMKKSFNDVDLDCKESTQPAEAIINQYACLFLDLRLGGEDYSEKNFRNLASFKLAIDIAEKCSAFPIIVFSSSQLREIDRELSKYGNIICSFRKPGIAGSLESIDGNRSLQSLFDAISNAFEMMENRIVFDRIIKLGDTSMGKCTLKSEILKKVLIEEFQRIFFKNNFGRAFSFPHNFIEDKCGNHKHICEVKVQEVTGRNLKFKDIVVTYKKQYNLNGRFLYRLRNLASHYIRDFSCMRREAIAILVVFTEMFLHAISQTCEYTDLGSTKIAESNRMLHPLLRHYKEDDKTKKCVYELFAAICYYSKSETYLPVYQLLIKEKAILT